MTNPRGRIHRPAEPLNPAKPLNYGGGSRQKIDLAQTVRRQPQSLQSFIFCFGTGSSADLSPWGVAVPARQFLTPGLSVDVRRSPSLGNSLIASRLVGSANHTRNPNQRRKEKLF